MDPSSWHTASGLVERILSTARLTIHGARRQKGPAGALHLAVSVTVQLRSGETFARGTALIQPNG